MEWKKYAGTRPTDWFGWASATSKVAGWKGRVGRLLVSRRRIPSCGVRTLRTRATYIIAEDGHPISTHCKLFNDTLQVCQRKSVICHVRFALQGFQLGDLAEDLGIVAHNVHYTTETNEDHVTRSEHAARNQPQQALGTHCRTPVANWLSGVGAWLRRMTERYPFCPAAYRGI